MNQQDKGVTIQALKVINWFTFERRINKIKLRNNTKGNNNNNNNNTKTHTEQKQKQNKNKNQDTGKCYSSFDHDH